jgi:hypothetical protein
MQYRRKKGNGKYLRVCVCVCVCVCVRVQSIEMRLGKRISSYRIENGKL